MSLPTRRIGPFTVSAIGLGCMNLSHAYGTPPAPEAARELLARALDLGVTLFDTAALYGFGSNESLVGPVLKPHRHRITLCSKGGMAGVKTGETMTRVIDGRPEAIRRDCEASLKRLGTDVIDLYYLHRWDKKVPIEDSVGELARLVDEGKVRALGLSEVSAATLRRAHAVHPIVALQSEYSLWSRNAELGALAACREVGAAYVAFSPLARAFLTGTLGLQDLDALPPKDIRRAMPRFETAHYSANLALLAPYLALAKEAGLTTAQLALAWVLARGEHVVALPGTARIAHLEEDLSAAGVALEPAVIARLDALFDPRAVSGARYNAVNTAEVDTEEFGA